MQYYVAMHNVSRGTSGENDGILSRSIRAVAKFLTYFIVKRLLARILIGNFYYQYAIA